ncbi:hypothetical protein LEAN103870_11490 [Legionella anisa]|nr:hypothetical protein [Legionella anisa]KTC66929.1 hypothetical protein Lani_3274 [Legionella anisa]MCW8426318.1 hypothetical protein [Legionella anisa]MCW8447978.1 hypothetical protein [Legionella anisa]UAK78610.1 hypothetical protein K8O89_13180 [Legionella anisa]
MDRIRRLRRVAILCCHFARNCSYYRASWIDKKTSKAKTQFWITIQSNFLDIAIMEWMKLFGNNNDQHHWKNIVTEPDSFKANMLHHCKLTSEEFDSYHKEMKSYRDQFVAHLDSELIMQIPDLTNAINTTEYYYASIYSELHDISIDCPKNLGNYYDICFQESKNYFDKL